MNAFLDTAKETLVFLIIIKGLDVASGQTTSTGAIGAILAFVAMWRINAMRAQVQA